MVTGICGVESTLDGALESSKLLGDDTVEDAREILKPERPRPRTLDLRRVVAT